ncbi:calcium-binding EGF-like domain-containing protein [Parvicella tangerina]|uniref:EGF-like domain-containing protein n=1 Tax=Parvicella tangerina TaxID=2829795 RepID=A0A916JQF0_9FLAO|nr:calcium-binding EGF-like domain-containing protein [Parvicella tangerina]CAG5087107.1 hypothetical protein CRYO30217_03390 [Parvicella tangerina]
MKIKFLLTTILVSVSLTITNCKKEGCTDPTATNYNSSAKKNDGSCIYPDPDPCDGISCLNGGYCANGTCNCPDGYSGSDCGVALTPTSMSITSATLTAYPMTNGGAGWDPSSGPDVYITINSGTSANNNEFQSSYFADVTGQSLTFTNGFPISVPSPASNYTIGIWDYETSTGLEEFMTGLYFTPIDHDSGFPPTITLSTASMSITLNVEWQF